MIDASIASIRQDYKKSILLEQDVLANPIAQFQVWFQQALNAQIDEANAFSISTIDNTHKPHSRIVLLKTVAENGFIFFTNYHSQKGKDIEQNPNVSLLFFWKELERQVRVEGIAKKIPEQDSNEYFNSRPVDSQIGAIASNQSEVISDRLFLDNKFQELKKQLINKTITKPENWGGYIVAPNCIEFWQGRSSRLHDRLRYTKKEEWIIERLSP